MNNEKKKKVHVKVAEMHEKVKHRKGKNVVCIKIVGSGSSEKTCYFQHERCCFRMQIESRCIQT